MRSLILNNQDKRANLLCWPDSTAPAFRCRGTTIRPAGEALHPAWAGTAAPPPHPLPALHPSLCTRPGQREKKDSSQVLNCRNPDATGVGPAGGRLSSKERKRERDGQPRPQPFRTEEENGWSQKGQKQELNGDSHGRSSRGTRRGMQQPRLKKAGTGTGPAKWLIDLWINLLMWVIDCLFFSRHFTLKH